MLRQKTAGLDADKPRAQKMPHAARKNWNMRSDVEYDQENMNHPIKVTENLMTRCLVWKLVKALSLLVNDQTDGQSNYSKASERITTGINGLSKK